MLIFIRTDASIQIGTGHVMRCLALAEALRDKGADVRFISRELQGNLNAVISRWAFPVHALKPPETKPESADIGCRSRFLRDNDAAPAHSPWLETSWTEDMAESIDAIKTITSNADWLIVDHYALDHRWESGMQAVTENIMVIDDLADRVHNCDLLLDQNCFENPEIRYKNLLSKNCRMLLVGTQYAILRPGFRRAREFVKMRNNGLSRILIYFGGYDTLDLSGMSLRALCSKEFENLLVDVVVGNSYHHLEELKAQAEGRNGTRCHIQPEAFVELMLRADLCIGAAGTSTWERLCLNLPTIVVTTAENQRPVAEALNKSGLIFLIGHKDNVNQNDIRSAVSGILSSNWASACIKRCENMVDGKGIDRIIKNLIPA
jgi:UDP-2,4-diacetamido-2,4,6-trideoxy-beta-L-altropyranose hydrolase